MYWKHVGNDGGKHGGKHSRKHEEDWICKALANLDQRNNRNLRLRAIERLASLIEKPIGRAHYSWSSITARDMNKKDNAVSTSQNFILSMNPLRKPG